MKKSKGSKGTKEKKLFMKRPEANTCLDLAEEQLPEEVGSRIEFEVDDSLSGTEPADGHNLQQSQPEQKPVKTRETQQGSSWQQAFADDNTILIKRTVRSGQCIQFDGNVVVMGDVNPGSEIIASGNIVVMGALRGVVHAGATGNEEATVSAFKLQPTQLRIANHITRAPDGDYPIPEHPETARIKDGVVVIEIYQLGQDRQSKIC